MGIANIFSGGEDANAEETLQRQLNSINALPTPSAQSLTLPQLREFVSAGVLTPEQAQTYLVNSNAYDATTSDNAGMDAELSTIGELQNIVNSGGADAETQATIQSILNTLGTTEHGNNEAILRDAAARGVSNAGTTMAARLASNQNDATNANANALNTAAAEEARNLAALTAKGTLGGQVQGQQYGAAANKASAANAIEQFNAQQKQQEANINTSTVNAAKAANLSNAQDISNKNTGLVDEQERSIPAAQQQAFNDALSKAGVANTAASNLSSTQQTTGEQNAGITGGLIGTAGNLATAYATGNPYAALASALAQNNSGIPNANVNTTGNSGVQTGSTGGEVTPSGIKPPLNMTSGGPVPGRPMVPGDSPKNDTQLAALSPKEIVLPVSVSEPAMRGDPSKVMDFLRSLQRPQEKSSIHPKAVLDTLRGLSMHHSGAV
jgi:hypothetical protein